MSESGPACLDGLRMVRVDALRKFAEVVAGLGGDPEALLARVQIDPAALTNRHAVIPYRSLVLLLERAAAELGCSDFGMRLAAAQQGMKVRGPLDVAMRNSATLRAAFSYCADNVRASNSGTRISLEEDAAADAVLLRFEILLARLPRHPQTLEHALLLTQHTFLDLSGGQVRAREVWFTHQPLSSPAVYEANFGSVVRFGQAKNGLLFSRGDFDVPVPNRDPQLYEMAVSFIQQRFPATEPALSTRVRAIIERLLLAGDCSYADAAAMIGMHPRTLQRRLRAEGQSFEGLRDNVRRDIALRYLRQPAMPLNRVAEMLGYSETSALSRSCHRWFAASPRQLREGLVNGSGRAA
jgi:AraC-like DNA-binding protein